VYAANPEGVFDLYRIAASGSGSETLVYKSRRDKRPSDWSPDGRFLVFEEYDPVTRTDILVLNLADGGEPRPIVQTHAADDQPRFAPRGGWIAYRSNRNGRFEVFVQRFPSGDPHMVSVNGGTEPFWRHDGRELFFTSPDNWLMTGELRPGRRFSSRSAHATVRAAGTELCQLHQCCNNPRGTLPDHHQRPCARTAHTRARQLAQSGEASGTLPALKGARLRRHPIDGVETPTNLLGFQ
jgi:hypothetical protein